MKTKNIELIRKYFEFYEKDILPKLKTIPWVTQGDFWMHWLLTHTDSVVFRGIYYAVCLWEDPMPVIFACALHDSARTDDDYNEIHWERAVPNVYNLLEILPNILNKEQIESVIYAVKNHTTWMNAPDYISACLWDADRTRLARMYWYKEKFMSADEAKEVSQWSASEFLVFQNKCLWRKLSEDREMVLR